MKAQRVKWGTAIFFNLSTLWVGIRVGVGSQLHASAALPPGKRAGTHCVQEDGRAPGPAQVDAENLSPTGIRSLDHPARIKSLYRPS